MNRNRKTSFMWFFLLILWNPGLSAISQEQNRDSLLLILKKDKDDTAKVTHLNVLAGEYIRIGLYDSALHYTEKALALAGSFLDGSAQRGISIAYNNLGSIYDGQNDYPMALESYFKALRVSEEIRNRKFSATILGNIGIAYYSQGNYPMALGSYFRALRIDEELNNPRGMAIRLGNIGNVYSEQQEFEKALEYYSKAVKIDQANGNKRGMAVRLGNMGIVYKEQASALSPDSIKQRGHLYGKALDCYFTYLKMSEEVGNKQYQATALGNIGNVYSEQRDISKGTAAERNQLFGRAMEYYQRALKIDRELGGEDGIAVRLGNIGSLYIDVKKYSEAEVCLREALAIDTAIGFQMHSQVVYEALSRLYSLTNRYALALEHYKKAIMLKDTLFNEEKNRDITRKEMNYEFEKKEAAAKAEADKQAAVAEAEKERQRIVLILVSCVLFLVLAFAGVIFRSLRITRRQKQLIEDQKHVVEEKQKEILDSIHYAKRIQTALLPTEKYIEKALNRLMKT